MFDSNEVLLDPSILVADDTERLIDQHRLDEYQGGNTGGMDVYVSAAFAEVVENCDAYREDSTFEMFRGKISSRQGILDYDVLQQNITASHVRRFSGHEQQSRREDIDYDYVYRQLIDNHPPQTQGELADVLFDEFVFLFERSWVTSRIKQPLVELIDADVGVRNVDFDDDAVGTLIDSSSDPVTNNLRSFDRRAGWEWAAVGGRSSEFFTDGAFTDALTRMGRARDSLALLFHL